MTTVFMPYLVPLLAAKSLFGAAAVSSGYAILGGGSLAAGGWGIAGGLAVSNLISLGVGGFAGSLSAFDCDLKNETIAGENLELNDSKISYSLNKSIAADITRVNSGPMGGDAEIAAMVVKHQIDLAIFLIDDLNPQPHEADIQMLLRQCRVHNVPIACNRYSADLMITSTLWDNDDDVPREPRYIKFKR